jgi:hypothetical protein
MISLSLLVRYEKIIDATVRGINEWKKLRLEGIDISAKSVKLVTSRCIGKHSDL